MSDTLKTMDDAATVDLASLWHSIDYIDAALIHLPTGRFKSTQTGVNLKFDDLPANAQAYVLAIEAMSGARISAIGVGPGRDAIVVRHDLLG